jgi:hypothetical protein
VLRERVALKQAALAAEFLDVEGPDLGACYAFQVEPDKIR